jgi:hypothetical protein
MDDADQFSLGSMEKLEKSKVIYIQILRINKMLSEACVESEAAIDTLECNLWADILKVGNYEKDMNALKKNADDAISRLMRGRDWETLTDGEKREIERIRFNFLKKKMKLLITIMGQRGLWGEEATEDEVGRDDYEHNGSGNKKAAAQAE